jgi:hypothetical protein
MVSAVLTIFLLYNTDLERVRLLGLVSDAKQNLIIKHADIRIFLNYYFLWCIGTDIQALIRGLQPDSAIIRVVTRIGRWID